MHSIYRKLCNVRTPNCRNLFEGVLNKVFNAVDAERRAKLGPDRVCAEWLLRNGAFVKFKHQPEFLKDYNGLPEEDFPLTIVEVEAEESSISHYGFDNFRGCGNIWKISLYKCNFLENEAMEKMEILRDCLRHLRIANCPDITDKGLVALKGLKLDKLELYNLPYVKNKDAVLTSLRKALPECSIVFQ